LKAGYRVEEFWLREKGMTPERFVKILRARNIHGVLLGRMPGPSTTLLEYDWSGFAVVALGLSLAAPIFNRVREDHFRTASLAAEQCFRRGYRRIGLVFDRVDDVGRMNDMWVGGFASEAAKWEGQERIPPLLGHQHDRSKFMAWFTRYGPDALVVSEAAPVRGWLAEAGLDVPRDVGLVELRCYDPRAGNAGVFYDEAKTGALAMETLIGLLHRQERGVPELPHEVVLQGVWIEGGSLMDKRVGKNAP
jgi:LacI family transcriptional regulator